MWNVKRQKALLSMSTDLTEICVQPKHREEEEHGTQEESE